MPLGDALSGFNETLKFGIDISQRNKDRALRDRQVSVLESRDRREQTQFDIALKERGANNTLKQLDNLYVDFNLTAGDDEQFDQRYAADEKFRSAVDNLIVQNPGVTGYLDKKRKLTGPKIAMISGEGGQGPVRVAIAGTNRETGNPGFLTADRKPAAESPDSAGLPFKPSELIQGLRFTSVNAGGESAADRQLRLDGFNPATGQLNGPALQEQLIDHMVEQVAQVTDPVTQRARDAGRNDFSQRSAQRSRQVALLQAEEERQVKAGIDLNAIRQRRNTAEGFARLTPLGAAEVARADLESTRAHEKEMSNLRAAQIEALSQNDFGRTIVRDVLSNELGIERDAATTANNIAEQDNAAANRAALAEQGVELESQKLNNQLTLLRNDAEIKRQQARVDQANQLARTQRIESSRETIDSISKGQIDPGNPIAATAAAFFGVSPDQNAFDEEIGTTASTFFGTFGMNDGNLKALGDNRTQVTQRITGFADQLLRSPVHGPRLAREFGYDYNQGAVQLDTLTAEQQQLLWNTGAALATTNVERNLIRDNKITLANDVTSDGLRDAFALARLNVTGGVENRTTFSELNSGNSRAPSTERNPNAAGSGESAGLTASQNRLAGDSLRSTAGRLARPDGVQSQPQFRPGLRQLSETRDR